MKFIKSYQEDYYFNAIAKKGLKCKKATKFCENFYATLSHKYGQYTCGEILKNSDTNGCCYFYSLLLARSIPGSTLVIGALNKLNSTQNDAYYEIFGHGWVEKGNLVFDTSSKQIFDKDFYYKNYLATTKEKFSHDQLENTEIFKDLANNLIKDRQYLKPFLDTILTSQQKQNIDNKNGKEKTM